MSRLWDPKITDFNRNDDGKIIVLFDYDKLGFGNFGSPLFEVTQPCRS